METEPGCAKHKVEVSELKTTHEAASETLGLLEPQEGK